MDVGDLETYYTGLVATGYIAHRVGPKWQAENLALEDFLTTIPQGATLLDAPVGTGRFFPFYKSRSLIPHGVDVSPDMLEQAREYAKKIGIHVALTECDIRDLPYPDNSFDVALCVRLLNLIEAPDLGVVLKELARVSRDKVLIGVRYLAPVRELGVEPFDLIRRCMRVSGLTRYHLRRLRRTEYCKREVDAAIREAGLQTYGRKMVGRRWDGTDYAFLLLSKAGLAESALY